MLNLMRENVKWLIGLIIFFFIGTIFVAWGVGGDAADRTRERYAAIVYDRIISLEALNRAESESRRFYRQIYGERFDNKMARALKLRENALNDLIKQQVVRYKAWEMGFMVSELAVTNNIKSNRNFQTNGRFDINKYKQLLKYSRLTPEMYEAKIREDLLARYLEEIVTSQAKVSTQEIKEAYILGNEKIEAEVIKFEGIKFLDRVTLDNQEVIAYFGENREKFRLPEQRRGQTIIVDPAQLEVPEPTDREMEEYYLLNKVDFQVPDQVKASHILFKTSSYDTVKNAEVRKKALEVLQEIRTGADFAEMAKEHSEDPSAEEGGDLGYFQHGIMVEEFDKAAFGMSKGEISDLVKTNFGYHIIKVTDKREARLKSLEESKKGFIAKIKKGQSLDLAEKLVETCYDQLLSGAGIQEVAKRNKVELKEGALIPMWNTTDMDSQLLASLKLNEISQIIQEPQKEIYKIVKLVEIRKSYLPELTEVKEKVELALKQEKASELAEKSAGEFMERVKKGKNFAELAKELERKVETTNEFTVNSYISPYGRVEKADSLFELNEGEISRPLKKNDNYYLFLVKKYHKYNEQDFQSRKQEIEKQLQRVKGAGLFTSWVENELKSPEIEIKREALN